MVSNNQTVTSSTDAYYVSSISLGQTDQKKNSGKSTQIDSLERAKGQGKPGLSLDRPQLPPSQPKSPSFITSLATAYAELETASTGLKEQITGLSTLAELDEANLEGSLKLNELAISREQQQTQQIDKEKKAKRKHKKKNWFESGALSVGSGLASGWGAVSSALHLDIFQSAVTEESNSFEKGFKKYGRDVAVALGGRAGGFLFDTEMKRFDNLKGLGTSIMTMGVMVAYYEGSSIIKNGHVWQPYVDMFTAIKQAPTDYKPSTALHAPEDLWYDKVPAPNGSYGETVKASNDQSQNNKTGDSPVANTKEGKEKLISNLLNTNAIDENYSKQKEEIEKMGENQGNPISKNDLDASGDSSSSKKSSASDLLAILLNASNGQSNDYLQVSQGLSSAV